MLPDNFEAVQKLEVEIQKLKETLRVKEKQLANLKVCPEYAYYVYISKVLFL